ncbi:thiol:disulfide interchange protein DsbD [Gelidibacter sediminis]|uniref:Thiol:disulfide interchange protein DsbD n=1 Tax=Gelidibacter sediminis TaxID=1608710 RepID=A0A4R7PWS8_9FLAO|nr:cytochrome c biogenesis protein CcdA [Gelidibacter sediminis]TDU39385.1 thiol:disulfide interchange protein DsbD [Gelidibacter sediminis]
MKNIFLYFFFITLFYSTVTAQVLEPVKWSTSVEKISDTEYDLIAKAKIDKGWHLYSQSVPENGPIATAFTYEVAKKAELIGKTSEEEGRTVDDPIFNMRIKYFDDVAEFRQRIKVINNELSIVKGEVEFMVCDDMRCLPPSYVDLNFDLNTSKNLSSKEDSEASESNGIIDFQNPVKTDLDKDVIVTDKQEEESDNTGLWTIFILGMGAGFIALFTPCVFPLIPMTVSFFTKQSKNKAQGIKNAFIYGLCIIVIYVILGTGVVAIFGASAINEFSTSVTFNLLFFVILVIFAVSFLGAFEIMLPQSWANKIDSKADKGGYTGIFFMALALAIVSFSCTGPFVGNIIVISATKGGLAPMIGMLGFSLALALPFGLFAAFPGWLNSLPKSGGWLNTVKVVLGFLELAFAFKFLSQADLVLQLHFLEREVFIAIWIAIFGALAFYLFGKIKLPHDSPLTHISVGRLSLGLIALSFTIYMIPGLWGAPLNLISAFPPPLDYAESPYGVGNSKTGGGAVLDDAQELPDGAHLLAPHQILAFNDYDRGLAYAKEVGKPIMLDFTGWACVNCRKMEQKVWPDDQVLNMLKNEVVLISLYVDDKRKLEGDEVIESKLRPGKKLKYIGQKWSEFQTIRYKTNTQPFYVLIGHDEENLNDPVGYTPDVEEYFGWMEEGVEAFKK